MPDVTVETDGGRVTQTGTSETLDIGTDFGITSYGSSHLLVHCRVNAGGSITGPTSDSGGTSWTTLSFATGNLYQSGWYLVDGGDISDDTIVWSHSGGSAFMATCMFKLGNVDPTSANWSSWDAMSYSESSGSDPFNFNSQTIDVTTGNDGSAVFASLLCGSSQTFVTPTGYTDLSPLSNSFQYNGYRVWSSSLPSAHSISIDITTSANIKMGNAVVVGAEAAAGGATQPRWHRAGGIPGMGYSKPIIGRSW